MNLVTGAKARRARTLIYSNEQLRSNISGKMLEHERKKKKGTKNIKKSKFRTFQKIIEINM